MKYNLDIESLTLRQYKNILQKQNLLPGRRILLRNIDENFSWFENNGMAKAAQLRKNLSTPQKIASMSSQSGITEEYLIVLKREISSLEQKPVLITNFPNIDPSLIERLNETGLKNSKDYWERNPSGTDELFCLCDLVRINGVGPVAAKAFYEAGYRSVLDVAQSDAAPMLKKVTSVNDIRHYYKAKLGMKDMQFCIDYAKLLSMMSVDK